MAIYIDGVKTNNVLAYSSGGGGGGVDATLISAQSANRGSGATLTYTFLESGTFQYVIVATDNSAPTLSDFTITLNGSTITPDINLRAIGSWQYPYGIFFGEITVNANDILTVQATAASNRGVQLLIFKDGSSEKFNVINFVENNDNYKFALNPDCRYFQVHHCGYYQSANNFQYEWTTNATESIATPSSYWYGFTYALTI